MALSSPEKEKLAVIIAARHDSRAQRLFRSNRISPLTACLRSVVTSIAWNRRHAGVRWKEVEVIVVDDGSSLPIEFFLPEDFKPHVRILQNGGTPGQAGALNHSLATIAADACAFTDSDCVVAEDWVSVLAEHYTQYPTRIGVVGPNWLFISPANWWRRFLTHQEALLMQFIFELYVDEKRTLSSRIDCRNLSIRTEFLTTHYADHSFFVEGKGPGVSGQTSYAVQNVLKRYGLVIGFERRLRTYHQPVGSLWGQTLKYYDRGRHGDFNQLYCCEFQSLAQAFLKRYLVRHFVAPSVNSNVFWPYVFLVHSSYWLGIFRRQWLSS